ncbi:toll-like receptor Tollo [Bradysia coprophila]|uniref:toll-like receptor Tollo n=1 Tax=Bradysia coprophila TaxID=38358 RepID=UPI00187D9DE4|nr:toll-like receptor Tollo [Bradysia coprophila]
MAIGKIVIVISLCFALISARSSLSSRNDATPKGCKWQRVLIDSMDGIENSIKHTLSCKLRTISGVDSLLGNLSVYQTDRISSLKLECSDVLFFESSLEGGQQAGSFFRTLRNLQELNIEYCKIRYVPSMALRGLRDLRTLSLRTHNTDWSAMNLELHPESFRGLTELRQLDLADNNIWSLPTDVFCPLFSLKELNLTRNRLTDVGQLGFSDWGSGPNVPGKACNTGLEQLDLSYNHIANFPNSGFSALKTLTMLNLQENLLTSLADKAFAGLQSLKMLNISSNRLIAMPPELFQSTRALTQLCLHNNTLAVLAPGLLEGLDRLEVLDLSQNELTSTWINRDTFAGLVRLVVLNLGFNGLSKIDQFVFHGLYSLQILNLEHNVIETIADNAFKDLKNLHALTLSHNKLKSIEAHYLSDLSVLNQLFFESNEIAKVDTRAFDNLTDLNDLSLNDNLLSDIPEGLRKLRSLKSLDLGKNKIHSIRNDSFVGLEELLGLRLVDNLLTNISRDTFKTLATIHVLNLASNQIKHIDQSAFSSNPTLRAIRLDNNELEDISGVFTSLPALVWLNVSDNKLRWFDYSHLPASLEWLDMHKNNITELGNYFDVRNNLQMKMLDVSYNSLSRLDEASIPDSLETLFANNNNIGEVAPGTFLKKKNIEKVVLYGNFIKKMDISAFALTPVPESREMPAFYLGDNPIHCDCHMEWLQRINELSHLRQHPRVLDLDLVMCTMEHERVEVVRPLMDLKSQDFLCKYESHCFALCHCCDYDACDCKMTCPDRCSCYHDHTWNTNVVDCGNAEYTKVPERIPMDATAIYLDGNNLGDLASHMFIGKKKLELLFLNNSKVTSLHNRTFNGVPSLKVLHIEENHLAELRGYEFDQLTNLSELYLDRNDISFIGDRTFDQLKGLEVLTLSDNKIVNFVPWKQLSAASESGTLSRVTLRGTKWKCNCESVARLQEWIKDISGEFDINQMICMDDRIVGEVIKICGDMNKDSSYATPTVQRNVLMGNTLIGGGYVPLLAAILVAIIGTALLVALACIFRQDVRLWAHAKYGVRLFKDPTIIADSEQNEKLYDAYILYSVRDSDFSAQIIATELNRTGYNLCLHHRDIHSTTYFNDSLQSATDASKKLILIVSMNFLQFEWSQPQFRHALQTVIENIRPAHRSHKIVLILTAPIEIINVDPVMQILIQTCPTICWGEKRFWDKLRYALPDLSQNRVVKKLGNVSRSPNLRYTPAPTTLDSWCKNHPGAAIPVIIDQQQQHHHQPQHIPSQSTSHTEDGSSSCASSQHYEAAPIQNYVCRSTASSLGHVYSTIPETPQMGRNERAYFV